ncbi:LuxR C-terminal-related transcriptional regulator [Aquimarina gracilis]|uniref:LuxR C-terminal-related transcriptional regulator n=1 Tax=Aquimarina gracilis TaxID=874422 RepID=A0ABU5ZTV9_9FLAO|nr:LuxR C-terminal-related transcriptional regulator [Aquimarina gracilis]MEB3345507.1 LuxR C-terminal-related transcriptional regulator [Aquimarina gracilis]
MKLLFSLFGILFLIHPCEIFAQYKFSGHVNKTDWPNGVYLSLVEDYRKIHGIYSEQIIQEVQPDSTGYFIFNGDNLPSENRIYRIHVDNCSAIHKKRAHLNGFCTDSEEILFIANNKDSISFPFSFDKEMFCKVVSASEKSNGFIKIDSVIDEMHYAFGSYRSVANRKINSEKWINTLRQYSKKLDEPLIELYVYSFLSNKTNDLYSQYLEDLTSNTYYDELLSKLEEKYPNSTYSNQYEIELAADKFLLDPKKETSNSMLLWGIGILLIFSISLNLFQFVKSKEERKTIYVSETKLTQQEQKILELILEDKTNKEIASSMFVSVSTVKTHINNLYKKLGTSSRDEVKSLYIK